MEIMLMKSTSPLAHTVDAPQRAALARHARREPQKLPVGVLDVDAADVLGQALPDELDVGRRVHAPGAEVELLPLGVLVARVAAGNVLERGDEPVERRLGDGYAVRVHHGATEPTAERFKVSRWDPGTEEEGSYNLRFKTVTV